MVVTVKDIVTSDRELVMPELTDLPALDAAAARDWIERWDLQQEVYMPDREDRFTALIDAVEAGSGGSGPPRCARTGAAPGARWGGGSGTAASGGRRGGRRRPGHALPRPGGLRLG